MNRFPPVWKRLALLGALALGLGGCFTRTGPGRDPDADVVTLSIVNHNTLDVVIYAVNGSSRRRIGSVIGSTSDHFKVHINQAGSMGDLQFYADPIGARRGVTSDVMHVQPGQTIEWTLETDLLRSMIAIRS